ncbi:uncharacterized protein [Clytia hemisphaerica]|uniref:DUF6589 domain-containing protein n=1 Tax=Clytia hemisphaerica TaxID=252671 RepID=A0A7M5WL88_9CNID
MDEKVHTRGYNSQVYERDRSCINNIFFGAHDLNENTSSGITKILREIHQFVPGHDTSNMLSIIVIGDLLTYERMLNGIEHQKDASTATKGLEGLVPGIADFHTLGNMLEALWSIFYDTKSATARNFLNARNVTKEPMKCVNASEEMHLKYVEAILLAAYDLFLSNNNDIIPSEQTKENYNKNCDGMVTTFLMPAYQMKEEIEFGPHQQTNSVPNYTKNVLALGYMVKSFMDARKCEDGERIIRLHKYLILYFTLTHKTKYALYNLHLLAPVNDLLPPALAHEITWNRVVNNKGYASSNVELERELQHRNKWTKEEIKLFRGTITEKSILRIGSSYDMLRSIASNFDEQISVKEPSRRHTTPSWKADVLELAEQYKEKKLFQKEKDKKHLQFFGFPYALNIKKFKDWAIESILKASKKGVYSLLEEGVSDS